MTQLTKGQRIQLFNALLAAFPGWDELREMVDLQLEQNLETISPQAKIQDRGLNLIVWAQANGYLGELITGAWHTSPIIPSSRRLLARCRPPLPLLHYH